MKESMIDKEEKEKIPSKRKNRKRWCGGHAGREHITECRKYADAKNIYYHLNDDWTTSVYSGWYVLVCTKCGKEVDSYVRIAGRKRPDWVVD